MQLSDALAVVRSGKTLAFLGSGFSLGATSVAELAIPTSTELASRLTEAAGETGVADFDLAADLFTRKHNSNPTALNSFLLEQFSIKRFTKSQSTFARSPWQRIYTTNYDNIVELASSSEGVDRVPVTWQNPPDSYDRRRNWVVHLHGFVGDIGKAGKSMPFLLGRQSYIDLELMKTPWPTQLQADLAKASVIFVIGFSFADLHIARLFRQTSALKRKTFVVVRPSSSEAVRTYAADFGTVVNMDIDAFMDALDKAPQIDLQRFSSVPLLSFVEHPLPETPVEPVPNDVFDLLISGKFNPANHL